MFTGEDIQFLQQLHQLKEISKIGQGSFGKVYKAIDLTDKTICAVKRLFPNQFTTVLLLNKISICN
ncbi:unnamed protein product [Paramecium sonneborni]|uniref:Protein kinase domain-containing protein n=1 Tax=Paramecium sonneborni TaxID=65129 RepID=A0A8S1PJ66_9CILI|nr:unnamed protein product [Paramecium sonneborni]